MSKNKSFTNQQLIPKPHTSWIGVFVGLLAGAIAAFHQFKLPPSMPLMLERYSYDLTIAGGFMSIYAAIGLTVSALLGKNLNKYGIRNYALVACGVLILGSLITIFFPELSSIVLLARAFEGLGFSILAIIGPIIAIQSASIRQQPVAVAIFASWIPVGQLIALGISQPAIDTGYWELLWWVGIFFTLLITLAIWLRVKPDLINHNLTKQSLIKKNNSPHTRFAMIVAAGIFTLWSAQYLAMSTWLPHYLVEELGFAPKDVLLPYAIPTALIIIFNFICGLLLRRGFPVFVLLPAAILMQSILWLLFDTISNSGFGIVALVIYGVAAGFTPTCLFLMPSIILGQKGNSGSSFGVIMTGRHLGVLAGPILLPQLLLVNEDWSMATLAFGLITLSASVIAIGLGLYIFNFQKNKT